MHLAVLNNLDKVISESIEVEEHPDYIKKDGKRSPENGFKSDILVHRFIGAIRVDEKEYRVKTTMYEYKQTDRKSREYAYDVTKIEVLDDTTTSTSDDLVGATMGLKPLAKLLKDVEKSYDKGKKRGRRMCRQLPLTSFSQCFLTKGKRLTGGCLISTPARLQTVHRRNASPHCKHRNSHYFRMRTLRTRVFPAASAFTT